MRQSNEKSHSGMAKRLHELAALYEQGQASELMAQTLHKLLLHEVHVVQAELAELQSDLAEFEQRYGMASAEFYRRYKEGLTDDRMDTVEWASLVQMKQNADKRLRLLTDNDPA